VPIANLKGADLRDATGLEEAQLAAAYGDAPTKLPEGRGAAGGTGRQKSPEGSQ